MSYYKQIDGIKYDRALLDAAIQAVSGRGDGRISAADAEALLALVTDGGAFTAVEQGTVAYMRENFTWTDKADRWFRGALKDWGEGNHQPLAVRATRSVQGTPVLILRVDSSTYLDIRGAEQAAGCAVLMVRTTHFLERLWSLTAPHKEQDLPKAFESALCTAGHGFLYANTPAVVASLCGGQYNGTVTTAFDNVSAAVLIDALKQLGCHILEERDLR
ncbi:MAG: hypothetical protein P8R54_28775 [Myxococcota bacterium]|nr:hypothetical protein [Myxococcota bacterium]